MNAIKKEGKAERMEEALSTLDLSEINPLVLKERGPDLAWTLLEVIDRTAYVHLNLIPDRTEGAPYVFRRFEAGGVRISRQQDGRWLFDRDTVDDLPAILDGLAKTERVYGDAEDEKFLPWHIRFRQDLPEPFKQTAFLLENWVWIALLLIIFAGFVLDRLLTWLLNKLVRLWRSRTKFIELREVPDDLLRPIGVMAMALFWWFGFRALDLPENAMVVLLVAMKFLTSVSGVWATYRLVDLLGAWLGMRAAKTENKLDDALAPLIPSSLKVFITIVGMLFVADNLNINISSLLAGLGLGGLAMALAAKDMVQNLFGSLTVLMDPTFTVGAWVLVGKIEGTVERIGFRSTRIRTFYNSLVTVPNSVFITAEVDNLGERRYRRLKCKLGVTYQTPPDRIEAFCEGIRELVRQHPYMRKDYFHIYFNEFGASSLDILVYVFWQTPDWATELRERHRFLLDVLRLASKLGVDFAYPTQTLFMRNEEPPMPPEAMSSRQAFSAGQQEAQTIVEHSLGKGEIPPPVTFPPG